MRVIFYLVMWAAVFFLSSCDQSTSEKPTVAAPSSAPASANPTIMADGEQISVKANDLPQQQILSSLAKQLGFEIKLLVPLDKTISVNMVNVSLRQALQNILSGSSYTVTLTYKSQVDFFPKTVVITSPEMPTAPVPPIQLTQSDDGSATRTPQNTKQQKQAIKQFQEKAFANNPTPAESSFLDNMTGTKEDAVRVMPILKDPNTSSDDKEDIIEMLQDGKREDVLEPLSVALEDKDPEVVITAIKAISSFDNPADIDILKKLSKSTTDDDVRQAAEDAIILLE